MDKIEAQEIADKVNLDLGADSCPVHQDSDGRWIGTMGMTLHSRRANGPVSSVTHGQTWTPFWVEYVIPKLYSTVVARRVYRSVLEHLPQHPIDTGE